MGARFQFSNFSSLVKGFGSAVGRPSFFGWYRLHFLTLARLQSERTAPNSSQSRLLPFSIDTLHVIVESNEIHRILYINIHQAQPHITLFLEIYNTIITYYIILFFISYSHLLKNYTFHYQAFKYNKYNSNTDLYIYKRNKNYFKKLK